MKRLAILFLLFSVAAQQAHGWGMKGHDIICCLAERHLTPKAKKNITEALGGHSIVYYSAWMDQVRGNKAYAEAATWHFANVDEGETYETMPRNPRGDVLTGMEYAMNILRDKSINDSIREQYIKYIIHMVADMHCPMHAGRLSDLGGNRYYVKWFGEKASLHYIWDDLLVEGVRKWSYSEWAGHIDKLNRKEIAKITDGEPYDWFIETVVLGKDIYMTTPQGANLSYDYLFGHYDVLEQQFRKGGYRLAYILNGLFG